MGIDSFRSVLVEYSMLELSLAPADGLAACFPIGSGPAFGGLQAALSLRAAGDLCHPERHALREDRDRAESCAERRRRFLRGLRIGEDRLVYCRQVHSRTVLWVDGESGYVDREADGLLTRQPEAVACVTVGDCVPIFLADRATGSFGILHSGWRGTGILSAALEMLRQDGSRAADLAVTLGPGIGSCCYAVEEERCAVFLRSFGPRSVRRRQGQGFLDLQAANLEILRKAGVRDVAVVHACTACTPALSSFRRDGPGFAHMLAFIGRTRIGEVNEGIPGAVEEGHPGTDRAAGRAGGGSADRRVGDPAPARARGCGLSHVSPCPDSAPLPSPDRRRARGPSQS